MAATVTVIHPTAKFHRPLSNTFASFGTATGVWFVRGCLKNSSGQIILQGKTLRNPFNFKNFGNWLIHLVEVPAKAEETYTLEITNLLGTILQSVPGLKIAPRAKPTVAINYPLSGDAVPGTFTSYGDASSVVPDVKGELFLSGKATPGTRTTKPPHWVIDFSGIVANTYTLKVIDTNDNNNFDQQPNIRVT